MSYVLKKETYSCMLFLVNDFYIQSTYYKILYCSVVFEYIEFILTDLLTLKIFILEELDLFVSR